MRGGGGSWYEREQIIPLGAYTAGQAGAVMRAGPARGLLAIVYVASAGTGNINLRISAREPFAANVGQINQNVNITTAGTFFMLIYPGCAKTPPGEAATTLHANGVQTLGIWLPDEWRISVAKSDASSWTFGSSARRLA